MPLITRYQELYEHEKDSTQKMLTMLDSVPESRRGDARFPQAVMLAGHLAACRENWLRRMEETELPEAVWFDPACDLATLRPRFAALENRWAGFLARLDDGQLAQEFDFTEGGEERYRLPLGVQIEQLVGHAAYHRGQVALLVDQLGGETVDTDYVDWWWARQ